MEKDYTHSREKNFHFYDKFTKIYKSSRSSPRDLRENYRREQQQEYEAFLNESKHLIHSGIPTVYREQNSIDKNKLEQQQEIERIHHVLSRYM